MYCDAAGHSQLAATCTRLAFAATELEADITAKNLILNGIPVLLFSGRPFLRFYRLTDESRFSIYVGADKSDEAKRLLVESELTGFFSDERNSL